MQRPSGPQIGGGVACPKCGGGSLRAGAFPWYLGTIGSICCRPVICNSCQLEFDMKKPQADWKKRSVNLCLLINGIGAVGILIVVGLLGLLIWNSSRPY